MLFFLYVNKLFDVFSIDCIHQSMYSLYENILIKINQSSFQQWNLFMVYGFEDSFYTKDNFYSLPPIIIYKRSKMCVYI